MAESSITTSAQPPAADPAVASPPDSHPPAKTESGEPGAAAAAAATSVTSPGSADAQDDGEGGQSPVPANASQGGREINKKVLYVGNIDQHVTEDMLSEVFQVTGNVVSIKIFPDKNKRGFNYAFVEYEDQAGAEMALNTLNGRAFNQTEIKINWAYQSLNVSTTPELFNVFVGDLSSEIDDDALSKAFSGFGTMVDAHVMWDMTTGRSRGYGFVIFRNQEDAIQAIQRMNGEWLGSRAIRCNWAAQKSQQQQQQQQQYQGGHHQYHNSGNNGGYNNSYNGNNNHHHQQQQQQQQLQQQLPVQYSNQQQLYYSNAGGNGSGTNLQQGYGDVQQGLGNGQQQQQQQQQQYLQASAGNLAVGSQQQQQQQQQQAVGSNGIVNAPMYDMVLRQAPNWQTTVYLGNIPGYTVPNDLLPILQNFGYVMDFKYQQDREYAFVKYDTHEHAAMAISQLSGLQFNGRTLRCGWGKDRHQNNHHSQYQPYGRQYNR